MSRDAIDIDAVTRTLDAWAGAEIAVRVVSDSDDLIAVWIGRLGEREQSRAPALFWPVTSPAEHEHDERPGIWVHPERLSDAWLHTGAFVVELRHGDVTLNVRRLH